MGFNKRIKGGLVAAVAVLAVWGASLLMGSSTPVATPAASVSQPAATATARTTPAATASAVLSPSACHSVNGLPDPICTPGATNPDVTQDTIQQTICVAGYTATIRPPASYTDRLKVEQMQKYNLLGKPSDYEEDHFIPLEVGGAPRDERNLWPQPWAGAHNAREKDAIENELHKSVCSGQITLAEAQKQIMTNWTAVPHTQ